MAQLNPSFEIDFNDINSYEQIQLINDTQLAKENLLMHRAYREPSDDEVIRNQFSSFTFVDFCPKVFTAKRRRRDTSSKPNNSDTFGGSQGDKLQQQHDGNGQSAKTQQKQLRHYELESFSDIFERINVWLKLNKDWQVVSMQTLVFDCQSRFNHLKSNIHANYLPRNSRGLRLYLSPSKSRFSGPQRIGCINVVPRKLSGSHESGSVVYENLDQILKRLNELLLTRPIEGRILSVETITLPIVNGFVNTESNYIPDSRLNLLHQQTYGQSQLQRPCLIDILRVYYEFGPVACGLVNLIDFVPRFYSPTLTLHEQQDDQLKQQRLADLDSGQAPLAAHRASSERLSRLDRVQHCQTVPEGVEAPPLPPQASCDATSPKVAATEPLTRLIRRSLAWFEAERKRILCRQTSKDRPLADDVLRDEQQAKGDTEAEEELGKDGDLLHRVNLKLCNLQVHHRILLKCQLLKVDSSNAIQAVSSRLMVHKPAGPIVCEHRDCTSEPASRNCHHLGELAEPFELRYVRLAYIAPVYSKAQTRATFGTGAVQYPMQQVQLAPKSQQLQPAGDRERSVSRASRRSRQARQSSSPTTTNDHDHDNDNDGNKNDDDGDVDGDDEEEDDDEESGSSCLDLLASEAASQVDGSSQLAPDNQDDDDDDDVSSSNFLELLDEEDLRQRALNIIKVTNARHRRAEFAHQLAVSEFDDKLEESPIGQLTYRLFAPCQLVKSSSCFSINPVNSSSPLSRRGSVDLNGGTSCDSSSASTLLLPTSGAMAAAAAAAATSPSSHHGSMLGDMIPHSLRSLGSTVFQGAGAGSSSASLELGATNLAANNYQYQHHGARNSANSRYTTNEFESVEAIRRRMEVYVTTNSMKVLAGETLIVNLSGALSCLSSALEQTLVRASFALAERAPSAWVCVYILYAAVGEPLMPSQLLAQQKLRELELINREALQKAASASARSIAIPCSANSGRMSISNGRVGLGSNGLRCLQTDDDDDDDDDDDHDDDHDDADDGNENVDLAPRSGHRQLRMSPAPQPLMVYNLAYDRTVSLPTHPENHLSHLDPSELFEHEFDESPWPLEGADERHRVALGEASLSLAGRSLRRLKRAKRKRKQQREEKEGQCSLI